MLHYLDINTIFFTIGDYPMSYIEFFGTIFNILCVYLASRNNIWNRPIGILGVVLYIFLFYQIRLYADLGEQFYFLITGFYGRYMRSKFGNSKEENYTVSTLNKTQISYYIIGILIGTVLLMYITSNLHIWLPFIFQEATTYVLLDSLTTILSFTATILMIRKKIECRILWILVDVIGIYLYYIKGVKFISMEYVVFLVLASYGLYKWIKIYINSKYISQK